VSRVYVAVINRKVK